MRIVAAAKKRFGRRVLLMVRPRRDRRKDVAGRCTACGAKTTFRFNSWVLPDDLRASWADDAVSVAYTERESMFCSSCCANGRVRRLSEVLIELYGPDSVCLADLVYSVAFRRMDIAEINTIGSMGSLHTPLSRLPRLAFSEYHGPDGLGTVIDGSRNEDICRLTYPADSFDLMLSSDTLEHVPDFSLALRESRRVLRPGGRHIFTVPIVATRPTTETRAEMTADGEIVHVMEPLYHGRGSGLFRWVPVGDDMLAFTEFGIDLTAHIEEAGLIPEVFVADGDMTGATMVFSARRPD